MMKATSKGKTGNRFTEFWMPLIAWGIALSLVVLMVFLVVQRAKAVFFTEVPVPVQVEGGDEAASSGIEGQAALPSLSSGSSHTSISRKADPHTVIATKTRTRIEDYIVSAGDSVFSIASKYGLKPETILWANDDQLDDNPNMLSIDMKLRIPPVDGVLYKWKNNDSIAKIAGDFKVQPVDILSYPGNNVDLANPVIQTGQYVMVPGGSREFRQWLIPTTWRPKAGATKTIDGPGGCTLPDGGAYGNGTFIWPASNRNVSGNDYWSGHLGIDIAAATGAPIYAADSGLVVYAGSIGGGYGLMVMIDHGNGYHTLYAHNSSLAVSCGQSVGQGQIIAYAGSTGNSTGPHLHFEVRLNGGFINPWLVLR